MAEVKEVWRFRVCDLAQYWGDDAKRMWSQLEFGIALDDYTERETPLYKLSRCKVTLTPNSITFEDQKGKRVAQFGSSYIIYEALPPFLRLAAATGLCYDDTPEGIAEFESA